MCALERNELATGQLSSVLFCEPSSCSPRLFRLGLTFWTGFLFRWVYFSLLQISSHSSAEIIATFLGAYDPGLDGLWTCLPKNPFSVSSCHRRSSCDAVLAFCHHSLFSPTENHFLWVTVFSHGESKTNKIKQTKKAEVFALPFINNSWSLLYFSEPWGLPWCLIQSTLQCG